MRDTNLVNALREHADWWENGDMMDPLGGLEKDLLAAADRIVNQSTHIAALQQEIEKLRAQNEQLRESAALVTKESAELLERRWIPVDERLPENFRKVLCWGEYFRYGDFNGMFVNYALGYQNNGSWGGEVANGTNARALAWMPLPEPPEVK